jgi:hypothetical protein
MNEELAIWIAKRLMTVGALLVLAVLGVLALVALGLGALSR